MRRKKYKHNQGFSILEIIVAFSIMTIGMLGVSSLAVQNIRAQTVNRNYLIASMLAQEGLELVRNIRDNNWLEFADWSRYLDDYDGTFTIDYTFSDALDINDAPDDLDDNNARLYLDPDNFYAHGGGAFTPFRRLITINEDASGDFLSAASAIRWSDGAGIHNYVAETMLYNWR